MFGLLGKILLLGAARHFAKRSTAAVETAALVLVLNERRLGRGPKRDLLLRAAHDIVVPAAVIKVVRLCKRLAGGGGPRRPGPGFGPLGPLGLAAQPGTAPMAAEEAAAAAAEGGADAGDPLAAAAVGAVAVPQFKRQLPAMPRPVPKLEWGLLQIPEVAPEYEGWVAVLRNVMAQQNLRLPPGFDPDGLELTRYLLYCGLLAAKNPQDALRAVAATAVRVTGTLNWRAEYPFMAPAEFKEWEDVTWWEGPDEDGTMWLHMHLPAAVKRCSRGEGRQCIQAIISQLEYCTRVMLVGQAAADAAARMAAAAAAAAVARAEVTAAYSATEDEIAAAAANQKRRAKLGLGTVSDVGGRHRRGPLDGTSGGGAATANGQPVFRLDDRIRVVVVGTGSNVRQSLRLFPLLRDFARLVQRHYPGRLRAMYLADMPRGARMGISMVLNLLSAETRQKVKVCKVEDLPDSIASALMAREAQLREAASTASQLSHVAPPPSTPPPGPATPPRLAAVGARLAAPPSCGHSEIESDHETLYGDVHELYGTRNVYDAHGVYAGGGATSGAGGRLAAVLRRPGQGLVALLVRVLPALLATALAAMACLTYQAMLARP
ncbi:hypothetical protein HYH03_017625 [Edaphochlamys debaryana]|uniref:CRAL-TRIO domain-containing protein n=1 Tax=Edaphochlamys debaryana TaxID=47281 RepID=A0A835XIP9_9CHLO|nr:hypothetical protein HYH03_017625 [Edaphochlamys debaryana]|eukprot:KAG2483518.1 hypothetical protein HYH03_017625 [Edaphochlamys debaryana]